LIAPPLLFLLASTIGAIISSVVVQAIGNSSRYLVCCAWYLAMSSALSTASVAIPCNACVWGERLRTIATILAGGEL
jgi:hypothetical protein